MLTAGLSSAKVCFSYSSFVYDHTVFKQNSCVCIRGQVCDPDLYALFSLHSSSLSETQAKNIFGRVLFYNLGLAHTHTHVYIF